MTMDRWADVWARRTLDPAAGSVLAQLMAADGLDTGFGSTTEAAWVAAVRRRAAQLGIDADTTVYEVGCGGGAFLYELHRTGSEVGGIDRSAALVDIATEHLAGGGFEVGDATQVPVEPMFDVVVSCGVFLYFEHESDAIEVLRRMVRKARRAVAVLDVPDADRRAAAMAHRIALSGGPAAYHERYAGLDHRFYERSWFESTLADLGLVGVTTADQDIDGYANSMFRFNAWGFVPD